MCISPFPLSQQEMLYFAIDNADLKIDTPDGKNQLHGAVIMAYQNEINKKEESDLVIMQNSKWESKRSKDPIYKVKYCQPPNRTNTECKDYVSLCSTDQVKFYSADDTVWNVLKSLSRATIVPNWAAYNSLLNERHLVTTICTLPLISGSPTNWFNLSTALNVTKKMLDCVTKGRKAIVSMDLQLYAKCIQLQEKNEIIECFIFRMGELHVVFTVLKVLGKIINNSGLDLSFEEAGIYGPATLCQIKEGKHLYRTLEAHFVLYVTSYQKYITKMLEKHPDIHQRLKEIIDTSTTATMNENSSMEIKETHNKIKSVLLPVNFRTLQSNFDELLQNQARFFRNYIYESL